MRLQAGWSGHGGRCGHGRLGGSGWARACTFTPFGKASPTEMAIPRANTDESARERDAARMPRPRERDAARSMPTLPTRRSLRDCQGVTGSHTARQVSIAKLNLKSFKIACVDSRRRSMRKTHYACHRSTLDVHQLNAQVRPTRPTHGVTRSLHRPQHTHERCCPPPAAMQITVGSYVRINEQCRNRAARGLLCRVQALERRRLSAIVPTQFAQVRVLGLDEHIQGDAPEWWTPCSEIRYVGDESSCIGTHEAAEAAARCFLPFWLSAGALGCSLEVPRVPSRLADVAARLRRARPCSNNGLRGRVGAQQEHRQRTTPSALPKLIPSEIGGRPLRLSAHEAQLATGSSLLHPSTSHLREQA